MKPTDLPDDWRAALQGQFARPYFSDLVEFVDAERATHTVYPPAEDVFNAFRFTPLDEVRVVLLGQDPYHGPGQAHGLCFSVKHGVRPPPSLVNIFKELQSDLGVPKPSDGNLESWARRGMLLTNAVMTVRAGEPNSHKGKGWEKFTDAVLRVVAERDQPVVFLLWGGYAQKKEKMLEGGPHVILKAAHPSPLSVAKFLGSKPFSKTNEALESMGEKPIDWRLP